MASTIQEGWLPKRRDYLIILVFLVLISLAFFLPNWKTPLEGYSINAIEEAQDSMWFGTDSGAFRIVRDQLLPVFKGAAVHAITEAQGDVWLTTDSGAYRIDRDQLVRVFKETAVHGITEAQGGVWFATDRGAYRIDQDKPVLVFEETAVYAITEAQGQIWLATGRGAYRIDQDKPAQVFHGLPAHVITEVQGEIWLATYMGAFRVGRDKLNPVLEGPPVHAITEVQNAIWIATDIGPYRVGENAHLRRFGRNKVSAIVAGQGATWFATDMGAFRAGKDKLLSVFEGSAVHAITEAQSSMWLATDIGAYRVVGKQVMPVLGRPVIKAIQKGSRVVLPVVLMFFVIIRGYRIRTAWLQHQIEQQQRQKAFEDEQRRLTLEQQQRLNELEDEQRRHDFELKAAREQFEGILPQEGSYSHPGLSIAHRRKEAETFAGDFYNFIPRGDGSLGIYFVDGEGHGLTAALQVRSFYRAISDGTWGLGEAWTELKKADALVSEGTIFQREEIAFCMNFTEIDLEKMEMRHANAGMPFLLLFRWEEALPHPQHAAGFYVGAGYRLYPASPARAQISVGNGDLLVMFSDGILEAQDDRGRIFGQSGITAAVLRVRYASPEIIADEIMQAVKQHTGKTQPDDDQTLAVVLIGDRVEEPRLAAIKTLQGQGSVFGLYNAGDTGETVDSELRQEVKTWACQLGFSDRRAQQILSATWEAIQNAIRYGSHPRDVIHIEFSSRGDDGFLEVEIRQPLFWEDWADVLGERRRQELRDQFCLGGTVTMLRLADDIQVLDRGRKLRMRFAPDVIPPLGLTKGHDQYCGHILGCLLINDAVIAKGFVLWTGFVQTLPIG